MKRSATKSLRLFAWTLIGFLVACSNRGSFETFVEVNSEGWGYADTLTLNFEHADPNIPVDLGFYIKSDGSFPYRNLFLFVEIESPEGQVARDTLECLLAAPDGKPLGNGIGSLRTVLVPFQQSEALPASGMYSVKLVHGMRQPSIPGIHSVGLRLDLSNDD